MDFKYLRKEDFETDIFLFHRGEYYKSYDFLGCHKYDYNGLKGYRFIVWAPHAKKVSIVGDFNNWEGYPLERFEESGLFNIFISDMEQLEKYKYEIITYNEEVLLKSDPYAFYSEIRPNTASRVYDINNFKWNDKKWIDKRKKTLIYEKPLNIYEMNIMSWKKINEEDPLSFNELTIELIEYLKKMNYTHVEFMPLYEHPFDGSWGYQLTGYFSITSRYGNPKDFMNLVNELHKNNIGVIVDWVPCHFCKDDHGLRLFDGSPLFEPVLKNHAENYQWDTLNFDYYKPEVTQFLISSAMFLFDYYHIDGIRVDAVSQMLYRNDGIVNDGAVEFTKKLNTKVFENFENVMMIAEESTAWPLVTAPVDVGGLGFNFKWNMGWMNDILEYMELDPIYRKFHQNLITFSIAYCFSENFILPLSHDEVVHGKKSLLDKMPGDYWQKFANLRLLFSYLITHPGKKLLFMGSEFAQFIEWDEWKELDWFLIEQHENHKKMQTFVKDLNKFYLKNNELYEVDFSYEGFEWIDHRNNDNSIISFMRKNLKGEYLVIILNFTPEVIQNYRIGIPQSGSYKELFNSDKDKYGGANNINEIDLESEEIPFHGFTQSIRLTVPPLGMSILKVKKGGKND
jgi:1,4-alpha-glucan branching enzyme